MKYKSSYNKIIYSVKAIRIWNKKRITYLDFEFTAISGWFKHFDICYSLHNVNMSSGFVSINVKVVENILGGIQIS